MESTDPPPATTAPPPSTAPDPAPPPTPAPITEESVAPTPPLQQPQAPQPGPPPAPSPQQQPPPSTPSSAPSQHPLNPPSQPQLQSQSQLQSQFQTPPQPPQTLAPPLAPAAQAQSQAQPQQAQQPQQGPPQPARSLRPTPPSFSSQFPPHVPPPAATAAGPSSLLPSVSPSLPPSSGPLQRGGMAIGVPATLHHPRAQQQSPVPFSSLGPSPTFGQTFNGLPRSSVGMTSMAASASTQVRQPVQAIQNVGVVGAYTAASIRPGGVPGNHQQRPGQSTLRSLSPSPSNNQSPTGQKFQSHGLIRGPSVSSPGSPSPGPSQSSQPLQQPWMSGPGRPTNAPSLPTLSYRPQNKPQGLQQRPHQPQQQQQSMPTSQQQQKLLQHSQQQQPQKQLQQLQQQHQQQQPPLQPQQQHQQVSLPIQSLPKVQQSVHQQQQLSRSASQKTLVPATLQQGATQPGPPSPVAGTDVGEFGNRILSKRSIHELVTQIDPAEKLDPEVEDILVEIAEDFVESGLCGWKSDKQTQCHPSEDQSENNYLLPQITTFGCSLAKHRKSTTLEAKDILLHLERNWNMTIPGFGGDEIKCYKKPFTNDIHKERLSLIKKSMISADAGNAKNSAAGQTAMNPKNQAPRASLIGSPKVT